LRTTLVSTVEQASVFTTLWPKVEVEKYSTV
jgi:hypothetical protein